MPRTDDNNLRCTVPGCKTVIRAFTGLQELQKLQQHMKRAHLANWTMNDTLENRVVMEEKEIPNG